MGVGKKRGAYGCGLLLILSACGDSVGPGTVTTVDSVVPGPQSVGVAGRPDVVVTFAEPLSDTAGTLAGSVFGRWSGPMSGVWQLASDRRTATFTPVRAFMAGEWVTVTLPGRIGGGYEWGFWIGTTAGSLDFSNPTVLSTRAFGEARIRSYGAYAGDLDQDGWSDLMIPNEDVNDVRVFFNDGAGGYDTYDRYLVPSGDKPSTNEGADLDGDGDIDLLIGNSRNDVVTVFLNEGDGTYRHGGSHRAQEQVRGLCVADFNLDGVPDVVTANRIGDGNGTVSVFLGDGVGGFGPAQTMDAGIDGETACAVGDVDRDGRTDVFIGGLHSAEIAVLTSDGTGVLSAAGTFAAGGGPWMLASGDLNGDGFVDVVSANNNEHNVAILFGDGQGSLSAPVTYAVGERPLAVDLGDLDGDGDLDVVSSNFSGVDFTVYENSGSGSLVNPRSYPASSAGSCAILHDRDNDGDLDVTGIDELDDLLFLFVNGG